MVQSHKEYNIITKAQNIFFDEDGFIVYSDEQIFDTSSLQADSLIKHFPFIDSVFGIIQQLSPGEPALVFTKVETVFCGLMGIYDFYFSREIRNGSLVTRWQVVDKTEDYEIQRDEQQAKQNDIILREGRYSFNKKNL